MTDRVLRSDLRWSCCRANNKADCTWAPCPANVDAWTPEELRALVAEDAARVDRAVAIFTGRGDA